MAITLVVPLLGISSCALVGFKVFRNCLEHSAKQQEIRIEDSGHFKFRNRKLYQEKGQITNFPDFLNQKTRKQQYPYFVAKVRF